MRDTGMTVESKLEPAAVNPGANTPGAERRTEPRFAVDEQATVLVVGHGMSFPVRILNLGLHGCRASTMRRHF